MKQSKTYISIAEWSKKNNVLNRRTRRLIDSGKIPSKMIPVLILGIPADFKLKTK